MECGMKTNDPDYDYGVGHVALQSSDVEPGLIGHIYVGTFMDDVVKYIRAQPEIDVVSRGLMGWVKG